MQSSLLQGTPACGSGVQKDVEYSENRMLASWYVIASPLSLSSFSLFDIHRTNKAPAASIVLSPRVEKLRMQKARHLIRTHLVRAANQTSFFFLYISRSIVKTWQPSPSQRVIFAARPINLCGFLA
jgi:hypothetical protein